MEDTTANRLFCMFVHAYKHALPPRELHTLVALEAQRLYMEESDEEERFALILMQDLLDEAVDINYDHIISLSNLFCTFQNREAILMKLWDMKE